MDLRKGGKVVFADEDIRKVVARRFGVAVYQVFKAPEVGCLCAVRFAMEELQMGRVTIVGGVDKKVERAIDVYCNMFDIELCRVTDLSQIDGNSCVVVSHRDTESGELVKVKKLVRRAKELNGIVIIDASATVETLGIDFKGLDIDICITGYAVTIADRHLQKSYKYIDNRYFNNMKPLQNSLDEVL